MSLSSTMTLKLRKDIQSLLAFFLFVQTSSSFEIFRGKSDAIRFGDNDGALMNLTDLHTMVCDVGNKRCVCKRHYNTLQFSQTNRSSRCVKDEDILAEQPNGSFIEVPHGKCLKARKRTTYTSKICKENDLSGRWLWAGAGQIVNVRTLRCLRANLRLQELKTVQCNSNDIWQMWFTDYTAKRTVLNNKNLRLKFKQPLYFKLDKKQRYEGCYRFSDNREVRVVDKCRSNGNKTCQFIAAFHAPLFEQDNSKKMYVDWKNSSYSTDGKTWENFLPTGTFKADEDLLSIHPSSKNTFKLNIPDRNKLVEEWSGSLVRLAIKYGDENGCVLIKIAGKLKKQQTLTSTKMSQPTVTSPPRSTANRRSRAPSLPLALTMVLFLCLLVAAIGTIVYFRRRKRLNSKQDEQHLNEDSAPKITDSCHNNSARSTLIPQSTAHAYECPGKVIPMNVYEYPTISFKHPNSLRNPPNNNNFEYDYATREQTSSLPLIPRDEALFAEQAPRHARDKSGSLMPHGNSENRGTRAGQEPVYHTLDESTPTSTGYTRGSRDVNEECVPRSKESSKTPVYENCGERNT